MSKGLALSNVDRARLLLAGIMQKLQSPYQDKIYVAQEYTKADLIRELGDTLEML